MAGGRGYTSCSHISATWDLVYYQLRESLQPAENAASYRSPTFKLFEREKSFQQRRVIRGECVHRLDSLSQNRTEERISLHIQLRRISERFSILPKKSPRRLSAGICQLSFQAGGGSRIFFRRGCTRLLLYFNTNKPHSFCFCRIPVVLENRRSSQQGCAPPAPSPQIRPCKLCLVILPLSREVRKRYKKVKVTNLILNSYQLSIVQTFTE